MKKFLLATLILAGLSLTGCGNIANSGVKPPTSIPIKIIIGEKTFDAILADTPSSQALIEKFPLDIEMRELNGNEKYYSFDKNLPTRDTSVMLIRRHYALGVEYHCHFLPGFSNNVQLHAARQDYEY